MVHDSGPHLGLVVRVDELRSYAHPPRTTPSSLPAHRPLEHVVRVSLFGHLSRRLAASPIPLRRLATHHAQPFHGREPGGNLVGDAVGEVDIFGCAEVLERQDQDAGSPRWRAHLSAAVHHHTDSECANQRRAREQPSKGSRAAAPARRDAGSRCGWPGRPWRRGPRFVVADRFRKSMGLA